MSGDLEGSEYSHDNVVRVTPGAPGAVQRLTRTHGCFAIDGLPRREPPEGHRERHYASRELIFEEGPPPTSAALLSDAERSAYDRDGFVACSRPLLSSEEASHHAALWEACWREEAVDGEAPGDAVNGYFKKYRGCYDLVSHPRVVQLAWCGVRGYGDAGARSGARGGSTLRRERPAAAAHQPSGPSGAFKRPSRFPMQIGFLWCFCMGAQGD